MPEYRLLREHSINRIMQPVGYELSLPEQVGDGLVKEGKAERIDAPTMPRVADPPRNPVRTFMQPIPTRFKCCGQR